MAAENGDHVVELVVHDTPPSPSPPPSSSSEAEIIPLLNPVQKPKINIFTISYPRTKTREQVTRFPESETSPVTQFILWVWSGSRCSGLLCMAISSIIYFVMEVLSDVFSAQSIPLFETAFTRCTIITILSYFWLRKSGHSIFGQTHVRKLLVSRALMGYLSLMSYVYCIQRLPLSQAIVLSFTTPIMASIAARIILNEKLKIADIGGLACSFFGVLFIFRQILTNQGTEVKNLSKHITTRAYNETGRVAFLQLCLDLCVIDALLIVYFFRKLSQSWEANNTYLSGSHHIYVVLVGLFSSITGGISYCLIRAGAKASDQPVVTVFSFGILASPAAGICTFSFEDFVLPGLHSFLLMLVLGVLAFFAEVFLARGLQLEKTTKAANVQYILAALSQLWSISSSRIAPSFGRLVGCLLILISVCCTMYFGPDKEME